MRRFRVSMRGGDHALVDAGNWLTALGIGLDQLGVVNGLDRLACEVLPNGTVIARDARTGSGYVVQPTGNDDDHAPPADPALSPDLEPTSVFAPPDPDDLDEETEILAFEPDTGSVEVAPESLPQLGADALTPLDPSMATTRSLLARIRSAPAAAVAWEAALIAGNALVPCESSAALQAEDDGTLRFVSATGPSSHKLAGMTLPAGKGIASFSTSRRLGLIVNNPAADQRFYREMDRTTGYDTRSILCVPVILAGHTWGCIELLNPPNNHGFRREHLDLLDPIARTLGARLAELGDR